MKEVLMRSGERSRAVAASLKAFLEAVVAGAAVRRFPLWAILLALAAGAVLALVVTSLDTERAAWWWPKTFEELVKAGTGLFVAIGLGVALWRARIAEQGQVTERFTRGVEQLGSGEVTVRLGGIYALERIAQDSPRDHWPVMEILCSYVRNRDSASFARAETFQLIADDTVDAGGGSLDLSELLERTAKETRASSQQLIQESMRPHASTRYKGNAEAVAYQKVRLEEKLRELALRHRGQQLSSAQAAQILRDEARQLLVDAKPEPEVQAIVTVLGRRKTGHEAAGQSLDLRGADLRRVDFSSGIHIDLTERRRGDFRNANLHRAKLDGALLYADLRNARLSSASLNWASLGNARLKNAYLTEADVRDATFTGADLNGADLTKANLEKAVLIGARGVTSEQLGSALGSPFIDENPTATPDDEEPDA